MHRSKSFAIVFRPHPNLAYHIHGPSKSSPSNSRLWSFLVLQIPGPANSVTPLPCRYWLWHYDNFL